MRIRGEEEGPIGGVGFRDSLLGVLSGFVGVECCIL